MCLKLPQSQICAAGSGTVDEHRDENSANSHKISSLSRNEGKTRRKEKEIINSINDLAAECVHFPTQTRSALRNGHIRTDVARARAPIIRRPKQFMMKNASLKLC